MREFFIFLSLILGLMGWFVHLLFILQACTSKKKGTLYIEYNKFHEMYLEIGLIIGIIIMYILVIFF